MLVDTNEQPIASSQLQKGRRRNDIPAWERFVQRFLPLIVAAAGAYGAIVVSRERTEDALRRITIVENKQDILATKSDLARVEANGEYMRGRIDFLISLQIPKK